MTDELIRDIRCCRALAEIARRDAAGEDTPWDLIERGPGARLMRFGVIACNQWSGPGGIYSLTQAGRRWLARYPEILQPEPWTFVTCR
jgi:hypothetical protein